MTMQEKLCSNTKKDFVWSQKKKNFCKNTNKWGHGGGQVVILLAFYSNDPKFESRWNLQFLLIKMLENWTKINEKEAGKQKLIFWLWLSQTIFDGNGSNPHYLERDAGNSLLGDHFCCSASSSSKMVPKGRHGAHSFCREGVKNGRKKQYPPSFL